MPNLNSDELQLAIESLPVCEHDYENADGVRVRCTDCIAADYIRLRALLVRFGRIDQTIEQKSSSDITKAEWDEHDAAELVVYALARRLAEEAEHPAVEADPT